ncbi:hypothetical protein AX15_004997 [Amanita polypyramis BW_CC]|nr:hypothetical protein AX15_004997 [Amanita polypyramis BW_CC]
MLDMEIDLHPLLCHSSTPNPTVTKRARSPEPVPLDRPLKRPVLVLSRSSNTDYFSFQSPRPSLSIVNTHPSEDWVSQAGYLSIDSPITEQEDTAMDESQDMHSSAKVSYISSTPNTRPPSLGSEGGQGQLKIVKSSPVYNLDQRQTPFSDSLWVKHRSPLGSASSSRVHTPNDMPQSSSTEDYCETSTTTSSAFSASEEPRLARKPRFTMGPRADCDLCRRGIKGHSAHWS